MKKMKYLSPSLGLHTHGIGLVHITSEGAILLDQLLQQFEKHGAILVDEMIKEYKKTGRKKKK